MDTSSSALLHPPRYSAYNGSARRRGWALFAPFPSFQDDMDNQQDPNPHEEFLPVRRSKERSGCATACITEGTQDEYHIKNEPHGLGPHGRYPCHSTVVIPMRAPCNRPPWRLHTEVQFHLVLSSTGNWAAHGASFGRCATKKQTIFGYRLHLLITVSRTILDFELPRADADGRDAACDLLDDKRDLVVIGDKGFISAPLATQLRERANIRLLTLP